MGNMCQYFPLFAVWVSTLLSPLAWYPYLTNSYLNPNPMNMHSSFCGMLTTQKDSYSAAAYMQ